MSRKLAHIEKVLKVVPIANADKIEVAQVLGWEVVVQKGEVNEGDLVVYYEIDAFLNAEDQRYAFLEPRFKGWGKKRGMRLKTIKLRGQISQGLILPISSFPEIQNPQEGMDVTELLKIEKWESLAEQNANGPRIPGKGGKFPSFIQKTDQERIQNYANTVTTRDADETFEVSIKLDGSSMTVYAVRQDSPYYKDALEMQQGKEGWFKKLLKLIRMKKDPELITGVCSRNLQLAENDESHFTNYVKTNGVADKVASVGFNLAFQGELIGQTIQDNHEQVKDYEYHVFDVFNIDTQQYFLPAFARFITENAGLKYVPVLQEAITLDKFKPAEGDDTTLVKNLLDYAEGEGMNKGVKREGLVWKSNSKNFSFKCISNSYLLKKAKQEEKE